MKRGFFQGDQWSWAKLQKHRVFPSAGLILLVLPARGSCQTVFGCESGTRHCGKYTCQDFPASPGVQTLCSQGRKHRIKLAEELRSCVSLTKAKRERKKIHLPSSPSSFTWVMVTLKETPFILSNIYIINTLIFSHMV